MWGKLRLLLAGLLLATAALKVWAAGDLVRSGGLLSNPEVIAIAVGFELSAAALIALAPSLVAHRVAVGVFALLAIVAGTAWWTGADCGCFGPRTVSGVPLLIDVGCLVLLLGITRSVQQAVTGQSRSSASIRWPVAGAFGAGVLGAITGFWAAGNAARVGEMPAWFDASLVGERFPLLQNADVKRITAPEGESLFVLLRPDCEHCREFATRWRSAPPVGTSAQRIVSVSISPLAWTFMPGTVSADAENTKGSFVVRWEDGVEPFVASPMLIAVAEHRVVAIISGDEAVQWLEVAHGLPSMFP